MAIEHDYCEKYLKRDKLVESCKTKTSEDKVTPKGMINIHPHVIFSFTNNVFKNV